MSKKPDEGEVAHVRHLLASKSKYTIGVDEVGMGAWAGPVFVSAVLIESTWANPLVRDSKAYKDSKKGLTAHDKRQNVINTEILPAARHIAVAGMSSAKLDKVGIDHAWVILTRRVILECLLLVPDAVVVVDGERSNGLPGRVQAMPKADHIVPAVSAASVFAKVTRDALMRRVSKLYPHYGLETNVGYGTTEHEAAINRVGLCPLHRRSYGPIENYVRHGRTRLT